MRKIEGGGGNVASPLSKADRARQTRASLIAAARGLFAEQGYANTSTGDIVHRVGVTRGALSHHFQDKADLFRAVFEDLRETRHQTVMRKMREAEGDLWQQLVVTGCRACIDINADPGEQRILFVDGPAVMGSGIWHENIPAVTTIEHGLNTLAAAGFIAQGPFGVLARLLWGAFLEAGLYMTRADDPDEARRDMSHGLQQLFEMMRINTPRTQEQTGP